MGGAGSGVNELLMSRRRVSSVLNLGLPDFFIPQGNPGRSACRPRPGRRRHRSQNPRLAGIIAVTAPAMLKGYPLPVAGAHYALPSLLAIPISAFPDSVSAA